MELLQLRVFSAVARERSFTRAAELLGYAQSSVSGQIRALEEELGTKLFERLGRQVALTKDGERLLAYAERLLTLAEEARETVSGSATPRGTLVIGAPESLCIHRLPALLQEYRRRYPEVEVVLKPGACADLRAGLRRGTVDVAFLLDRTLTLPDLVAEPLCPEPMALVAPAGHPLASRDRVTPADLNDACLLLTEKGGCYRVTFEQTLAEAGAQPGSVLEFGSVEVIKKCVASGLGLTMLPRMAVEAELNRGQLVELRWSAPEQGISTQVVRHRGKWLSPALSALLSLARELLAA